MIRQLTEQDHEKCLSLLKQQPAENLFIIGDIEAYGYEHDFQKVWGEFGEDGRLKAVLLKYEENFIPYAAGDFNAKGFAEIMLGDPNLGMMSGLIAVTAKIEPYVSHRIKRKRETYYAKCIKLMAEGIEASAVCQAGPEDAEQLVELLHSILEFSDSAITVERKRRGLKKRSSKRELRWSALLQ